MNKKRYAASAVVFLVLAALVYLQFRTWRNFDWDRLFQYGLSWRHIFHGSGALETFSSASSPAIIRVAPGVAHGNRLHSPRLARSAG
jgi:hypothetical protein